MKQLIFILLGSFTLFSCGGGEEKSEETEKNKEKAAQVEGDAEVKKEIIANAETTINIDGMVCEHACVSSVKKNILAMEGVSDIIIDFVPERKVNSCVVKFDDKLVSKDDFVKKINEINDGAYKVVEDAEPENKEEIQGTKKKAKETEVSEIFNFDNSFQVKGSDMGDSFFSFPSLFDIFTFGF